MQYVLLMNLTDQGAKEAKDIPRRIAEGIAAFEKMGGTAPELPRHHGRLRLRRHRRLPE